MSSPDPDPATAAPSRAVADCKVFVGGLHPLTTAETLCGYFGRRFGEVIDAVVMIDRATGRSRGFGFVTFREAADAASAIEASATAKKQAAEAAEKKKKTKSGGDDEGGGGGGEDDDDDSNVDVLTAAPTRVEPLEVDGKVVDAKLASSSSRGGENANANANASSADAARADAAAKRLFVGGLTRETTEDSMREYFSQFGDVVKAEVMRHTQGDHKGESRCFGFVTFDAEEATDAVFTAGEDGDGSQGGGYHQLDGKRIQCKRIDVDAPRDSHAHGGGGGGGGGRRDRDGGGGYRNNQRGGRYDDRGYGYGYGMGASVGPGGGMMMVNPGMYGAYGALVASQGMAGMNAMMPAFGAMTAPAFYQTYGGGGGGRFGRGGSGGRGGGGRGGGRYRPY